MSLPTPSCLLSHDPAPLRAPGRRLNSGLTQIRRLCRWFWKCNQPVKCKFFEWQDKPSESQSQPWSTPSRFPASSGAGNRLGSSTPTPQLRTQPTSSRPPATPIQPKASASNSRKRREVSPDWDEEELEAMATAEDHNADDILPCASQTTTAKKAKFNSFSTPPPATSASGGRGGGDYDKIMSDPTSPFHARQKALFPESPTPSAAGPSGSSQGDVKEIEQILGSAGTKLEAVKREIAKKDRLIEAGRKKALSLQERLTKREAECKTLKNENAALHQKSQSAISRQFVEVPV